MSKFQFESSSFGDLGHFFKSEPSEIGVNAGLTMCAPAADVNNKVDDELSDDENLQEDDDDLSDDDDFEDDYDVEDDYSWKMAKPGTYDDEKYGDSERVKRKKKRGGHEDRSRRGRDWFDQDH